MDLEAVKVMTRLNQHLEFVRERGYQPIYIALYGSQNYQLETKQSDVDTKAIVLPSLEDIVLNKKPVSMEIELPNGEHCDIKDIRLMFNNFKKQNINFLEILFTNFYLCNSCFNEEIEELRSMREDICRYNQKGAVKCMEGMAKQKFAAMEHRFPTKEDIINKYGYDPKQLHHIIRMREFLERYIDGESFEDCLLSKHREYLLRIKKGDFPLLDARQIANTEMKKISMISAEFLKGDLEVKEEVEEKMNDIMLRVFKKKLNIV